MGTLQHFEDSQVRRRTYSPHFLAPSCNTHTTMLQQRSSRLLSSLSHCAFRSTAAPLSASLRCRTQRPYSIHADASVGNKIQDIDPTKLSITRTTSPKDLLPPEDLIFGRNFTGRRPNQRHSCVDG